MNKLIAGAVAALAASAALAQTTPSTTDHPKPIATSQQTADEASQKAAQEGAKTATFVRTGPSAADHVANAAAKTKHSATRVKNKVANDTSATDTKSATPQ